MARELTENETFASALVTQLQTRSMQAPNGKVLGASLESDSLPAERAAVFTARAALHDLGVFAKEGPFVRLSPTGHVFLAYVVAVSEASSTLEDDIRDHAVLTPLLLKLNADLRLQPPSKSSTQVQDSAPVTPASGSQSVWNVWTIALIVLVLLGVYRLIAGPK
ncbi:MAG: hypothetical protein EON54_18600 [Alcaligenaceae bacterium]|nr:MAG: hypothetical protein EON54_18600 [Alcaligenaceae bacterium]